MSEPLRLPAARPRLMADRAYLDNLVREADCPLCGAERKARASPAAERCAKCGSPVGPEDAKFAIAGGGTGAACSTACMEALLEEPFLNAATCGMCGAPWLGSAPGPRSCAVCGTPLELAEGYAALWRGHRLQTFCGSQCLGAYLGRANPFCG